VEDLLRLVADLALPQAVSGFCGQTDREQASPSLPVR
jgi:hypothetical protein